MTDEEKVKAKYPEARIEYGYGNVYVLIWLAAVKDGPNGRNRAWADAAKRIEANHD